MSELGSQSGLVGLVKESKRKKKDELGGLERSGRVGALWGFVFANL